VLFGANPLLLTTTFSAAHLEAVMLALLLLALYAFRSNRPVLAMALAVAAGLVKVPALAAVPFFALEHWRAAPSSRARLRVVARDAATTGAALAACGLLVPHGWGWTSSVLHTPAIGREWWTPSTLLAEIGVGAAHVLGLHADLPGLLNITRSLGLVATAVLLTWLLFRRGDAALRLGLGLSALAILGFVLYPWYLLWGWPLVVIAGRRRLVFGASVAAALFTLANAWPQRREASAFLDGTGRHPLTSAIAAVAVLAALLCLVQLLRGGAGDSEDPATAEDVTARIGSVQTNPPVVVEQPRTRRADGRGHGKGRTPADPEEEGTTVTDVDAEAVRPRLGESTVGEGPGVVDLIERPPPRPPDLM
jgi:hypothetical protein